ncbi:MAG: type II/IV secretion system protein [Spirochaetales bacterium]|nr:type II/IV secretion system protein [Spirochaetales bacterium]
MITVSLAQFPSLSRLSPLDGTQYPIEYMKTRGCAVLERTPEGLTVGISGNNEKEDKELMEDLKAFHTEPLEFVHLDRSELISYISRLASDDGDSKHTGPQAQRFSVDRLADDAPNINLVNSIIIDAIRKKASDIHLECYAHKAPVRYRIDGVLHDALSIGAERFAGISSRLKIMAGLNIMERRLPQDGRMSVDLGSETVDMRISTVPVSRGESIVLRIFNKQKEAFQLEDLGFPSWSAEAIEQVSRQSNGLFLVTGPTGSGKSTTLYALLRKLNKPESKIVTIEDPIEQEIEGVNQIQVHEAIGLSFTSLLRRILRQDPDIIMVGEIRDADTAELAVRAAMTGHLVLATLHTNDAVSSIHRLCNMGIPPYLLGAVLRGVLAQRLVRKLCPKCMAMKPLSGSAAQFVKKNGFGLKQAGNPVGCETCGQTGYTGRTALIEVFTGSYELEDLIAREASTQELRAYLSAAGMRSLLADGREKLKAGVTSVEELERVITF